jgi:hypothetical protein
MGKFGRGRFGPAILIVALRRFVQTPCRCAALPQGILIAMRSTHRESREHKTRRASSPCCADRSPVDLSQILHIMYFCGVRLVQVLLQPAAFGRTVRHARATASYLNLSLLCARSLCIMQLTVLGFEARRRGRERISVKSGLLLETQCSCPSSSLWTSYASHSTRASGCKGLA